MKQLFENKWVVLGAILTTAILGLVAGTAGVGFGLAVLYISAALIYELKKKK